MQETVKVKTAMTETLGKLLLFNRLGRIFLVSFILILPTRAIGQCNFSMANIQVTPASCYGATDGSISFTVVSTNNEIDQIAWTNVSTTYVDPSNISGLGAGNYSVMITDSGGCSQSYQFTISQPDSLVALATNKLICPGENVRLIDTVSGGTGPYHYSWTSTSGLSCINCAIPIVTLAHSQVFSIVVSDANGCTSSSTMSVTVADTIQASLFVVPEKCGNDGRVVVNATGGTNVYRYSLNGSPRQSVPLFKNLMAGSYVVEVVDSIGCSRTKSFHIPSIKINLNTNIATQQVNCPGENNGSLTINTTPNTAAWFSLDSINLQTNPNFSNLQGGNYTVFVQDTNGCVRKQTTHIFEPLAPSVAVQKTDLSCFQQMDGVIAISSSGSSYPIISYHLNAMANSQPTGIFHNLAAGKYTLFLTDSNSCVYTDSVKLSEPEEIRVDSMTSTGVGCNGDTTGTLEVYASGGQSALQFSLDGVAYQSSNMFDNLEGGTYHVYIMDTAGCQTIETMTITEPPPITIDALVYEPSCNGDQDGVIIVITSGGTTPLVYSLDGEDYQYGNTFDSLSAGVYVVFVKDTNNCIYHGVFVMGEPDELTGEGVITIDSGRASIDLTMSGGTWPYDFVWSHGDTTEDVSNLTDGSYSVIVTDSNGCEFSEQFDVIGTGMRLHKDDHYPILIYPIPNSGTFYIRFGLAEPELVSIRITDIAGNQIIQNADIITTNNIQKMNINAWPAGIYLVRIHFKDSILTRKVIKY